MSTTNADIYIYRLPYAEKKHICSILDQTNKWEELGLKHMQFDEATIQKLKRDDRRGQSPSTELLTLWADQNHTVLELFIILGRVGVYQAMSLLKPFVDERFHVAIKEDNINNCIQRLHIQNSKVPSTNFDKNTTKNVINKGNVVYSNDNNETNNLNGGTTEKPANDNQGLRSPRLQGRKGSTKILTAYVASSAGSSPQIQYDELEVATDGWNNSRILGQGGFGTVFKGKWKCTQVAIKRLEIKENSRKDINEQIRQSVTELHCLNAYRHDNILPLYGYSIDGPHPCLIYQYMPGGSLDGRIRTRDLSKVLNWPTRLQIAIGTARGLQYLHTTFHSNKPLIHGDIKSANILLDLTDQPRIGDFGLAREGPERDYTHIQVTRVHGTVAYLPIDFLRSKQFSTKIDTYSFGVVLFELATACPPASENKFLRDRVVNHPEENILQLKDSKALSTGDFIFRELIRVGKICVQKKAKERPEMVNVLAMLEEVEQVENNNSGSTNCSSNEVSSE